MISQPLVGYLPDRDPAVLARVMADAGLDMSDDITLTLTDTEVQAPDGTDHAVLVAVAAKFAPITPPIPEQVSRLQARLALIEVDLWDAVVAYFADPDRTPAEMAFWEDAQTWRRADPVIAAAGTALGLTAEQIDELFRNAANR